MHGHGSKQKDDVPVDAPSLLRRRSKLSLHNVDQPLMIRAHPFRWFLKAFHLFGLNELCTVTLRCSKFFRTGRSRDVQQCSNVVPNRIVSNLCLAAEIHHGTYFECTKQNKTNTSLRFGFEPRSPYQP